MDLITFCVFHIIMHTKDLNSLSAACMGDSKLFKGHISNDIVR